VAKKHKKKKLLAAQNKAACKRGVAMVRNLFKTAQSKGCLRQVWRLVTALRHNDYDENTPKMETTTTIRQALLSKKQAEELHVEASKHYYNVPIWRPKRLRVQDSNQDHHFVNHLFMARDILNSASK
jgi:hypothetical protein